MALLIACLVIYGLDLSWWIYPVAFGIWALSNWLAEQRVSINDKKMDEIRSDVRLIQARLIEAQESITVIRSRCHIK